MFTWAAAVNPVFGFLVGYAVRESISRRRPRLVRRPTKNGIANSIAIRRCRVLRGGVGKTLGYFSWVGTELNVLLSFVPRPFTTAMMATAMPANWVRAI
jgi:hypothetical protein